MFPKNLLIVISQQSIGAIMWEKLSDMLLNNMQEL